MKTIFTVLLGLFLFIGSSDVYARKDTITLPAAYQKNVIKWNLTPFLLWSSNNINLSYERVLNPYRTFSVNAGYFELPTFGSFANLRMDAARGKVGFSAAADYRFYFKKRNTKPAPDGLYWGPYASWYHYAFTNDFSVSNNSNTTGSLSFDGDLNIFNAGVQLGYQFVIKEKFTVDLIFLGPSVSLYSAKIELNGNIDVNLEDDYLKTIRDMLISKIPFLEDALDKREFNARGVTTMLGPGLRYMIQIGYRF